MIKISCGGYYCRRAFINCKKMCGKHTHHGVLAPVLWHITHIEIMLSPSCPSSNHLFQCPGSWNSFTNFMFLSIYRTQQEHLKIFLLYDCISYISCNHHVSFYHPYVSSSLYSLLWCYRINNVDSPKEGAWQFTSYNTFIYCISLVKWHLYF